MICGKIAAGKSTLAAKLALSPNTVVIAEDDWLNALFANTIQSPADYVRCAAKLREAMKPHLTQLLDAGVNVVLDFPANTIENRAWMREAVNGSSAAQQLHVLNPPDAVCLERLHARNAQGDHPFSATQAQFELFSKHFVLPTPEEGFDLVFYPEGT